jgi:hypothetical protein
MSGADVFSFDKSLLAYLKVRSRSLSAVCRTLITFLCSGELTVEFCVEFVEVDNELMSVLQS